MHLYLVQWFIGCYFYDTAFDFGLRYSLRFCTFDELRMFQNGRYFIGCYFGDIAFGPMSLLEFAFSMRRECFRALGI